ncbi:hypothetical protein [Thiohalomonas denitrificans]|uniref:hypothetical protein n=1 Tax=Thiohalomonas denitrificans TaxID=415747 RepID=UPI0026EB04C2|nr:hypothetical protein [Thiohalomonas denitrificans]
MELDYEERRRLATIVMAILDEWKLDGEQQLAVLGMPGGTRPRHLNQYRQGTTPFPQEAELIDRARHIIGIQEALHLIFSRNPLMPSFWLSNPNNRQFGQAPVSIMLEDGLPGMEQVWGHLDCTRNRV